MYILYIYWRIFKTKNSQQKKTLGEKSKHTNKKAIVFSMFHEKNIQNT